MLFDVMIIHLVCGYTLGSCSVGFCLQVTLTLTSGLNFRKIMSLGAFVTFLV